MSSKLRNQKQEEFAKYMKAHPDRYPDSVRRPHNGCGSDVRKAALRMGRAPQRDDATFMRGMLGAVLAARLGYGNHGIPEELLG